MVRMRGISFTSGELELKEKSLNRLSSARGTKVGSVSGDPFAMGQAWS